ncbi:MAG: valine--tRNA ligase [Deltaproteobacteria bacterium]|nr:valine--tRNA ligase [Deltaproteobacteria bacterium]
MEEQILDKSYDPRKVEEKWYQFWQKNGHFRAADSSDRPPFAIVIPPPNVTGMLHMGHALNNTLQDIIIRYKRMLGFNVLWMPGTDHAGIATQNVVEKEIAKEGITRHDIGRESFIERVWQWKKQYGGIILNQLQKLGCSCDWERERFTMDEGLSRAVREVFVRLYKEGHIFRGDYIVNWCPRCLTAISDLEVEYEEEQGGLWHIRYPFADGSEGCVVVATTRPETMLGDTAVAVNPADERYKGMVGARVILPLINREIPIIADNYVTVEFGTGAVKITPACDPNDFAMAQRHDIGIVSIMDGKAMINENGGPYNGQDRYECRNNVIEDLKKGGYLLKEEPYKHNVGRCYRCKTVIEPTVSKQWFVRVQPLAKRAIAAVVKGETRIIPSVWEGTYFEWMDNIRDWCISRQIWWGHRIPVWYCDECGEMIVSTEAPERCHHCKSSSLRQEEDVLDTWFSSALWPFSTLGWPEETPALKTFYPTSLLITGFDILFFWVARMMMMGLYVMKDVPFRDVYLHALVRDEQGDKMSKSKGNIIDPLLMVERYGADALRFTLAAFSAQGRDVKMSEGRIEGYRNFVNKLWNAARFSLMNCNDVLEDRSGIGEGGYSLADRWIMDELNKTVGAVTTALDEYRFNEAAAALYQFTWHEFCDWYLEMIKPVLYGGSESRGRKAAQKTLCKVLDAVLRLLHPFMPFVTEEIWQKLKGREKPIIVSDFPRCQEELTDSDASEEVAFLKEIITCIRNIRGVMGINPSKKLPVTLQVNDVKLRRLIDDENGYIIDLANLGELSISEGVVESKNSATSVVGSIKIYVHLEGLIDVAAERARLEKTQQKIEKDLEAASKKLRNSAFLGKASPDVIEKERDKHNSLMKQMSIICESLLKLKELEG